MNSEGNQAVPQETLIVAAHVYALKRAARMMAEISKTHSPEEVLKDLLTLGFHQSLDVTPSQMEADLAEVLRIVFD